MQIFGVALAFLLSLTAPAWSAEETIVQQLAAGGARSLRPFTIKPHWEIRWTSKDAIAISVLLADADPKNPLAKLPVASGSQMTAGSGSTYVEPGGHYYLQITSMADWTITVVQLP